MEIGIVRSSSAEVYGRVIAMLVFALTASLIGTNRQSKILFQVIAKTASYQSIDVFVIQMYVESAAAAYNLMQLIRCISFPRRLRESAISSSGNMLLLRWVTFLIDQTTMYAVLGANCASMVASLLAVTGNKALQWEKLCNVYTRFCFQVGGYLLTGFVGSIVMASLSSISAYNLFRLYSSKHLLRLKRSEKPIPQPPPPCN